MITIDWGLGLLLSAFAFFAAVYFWDLREHFFAEVQKCRREIGGRIGRIFETIVIWFYILVYIVVAGFFPERSEENCDDDDYTKAGEDMT